MTAASPITVGTLGGTAAECERWDRFVARCSDATFFHLSTWRGLLEEILGHRTWYLYAEREGEIQAVLPLARIKSRLFGTSLISLPFCVYGGIAGDVGAHAALETHADELARSLRVEHLEYRNLVSRHSEWPRQDIYVTFRKSLHDDDEANLLAIPRKQRAMVRKAGKRGLSSRIDDDVDRFYRLYAENVRRHGTPGLSRRYFAELKARFGKACEVLTVSDDGGRAVSSVMSFYFRDEVLPYYAGDDVAARRLAANDFKYWQLMRRARERGCRIFDYGRSKVGTGSWHFKKNWGFEPQSLYYEYRLYTLDAVPQKNPLNPKYRPLIALWRRLPLGVTNRVGPLLARKLG